MAKRSAPIALVVVAAALIGLALAIDVLVVERSLAEKGTPRHSPVELTRMVAIAIAAALLVISLEKPARRRSQRGGPSLRGAQMGLFLLPLAVALSFLILLQVSGDSFASYAREDGVMEFTQAAILFVAAGLLAYRCGRGLRGARAGRTWLPLIALAAVALLLVALEEVSWGQRLFGFEASGLFASNGQGETNLHNFATHESELVLYLGFFALLLVAYLRDRTGLRSRSRVLEDVGPSPAVLLAATPAIAFNYGEWGQLTTQLAVFMTLAILVAYVVSVRRSRPTASAALVPAVVLVGFVAIQVTMLVQGDLMLRWWQNGEYKELLGALVIVIWALEVARRPLGRGSGDSTESVSVWTPAGPEVPSGHPIHPGSRLRRGGAANGSDRDGRPARTHPPRR